MASLEFIHKSNFTLLMVVGNIPINQQVSKMYFMVKNDGEDADEVAILSKVAVSEDNSVPGVATISFTFIPTDLDVMLANKTYAWFSKVILSGGGAYSDPTLRGTLTVLSAGVKATS